MIKNYTYRPRPFYTGRMVQLRKLIPPLITTTICMSLLLVMRGQLPHENQDPHTRLRPADLDSLKNSISLKVSKITDKYAGKTDRNNRESKVNGIIDKTKTSRATVSVGSDSTIKPEDNVKVANQTDTFKAVDNNIKMEKVSIIKSEHINCAALYRNDKSEQRKAIELQSSPIERIGDEGLLDMTTYCEAFIASRGYIMSPLTTEEAEFPLAFSIVLYKESDMVERLLRAIYRPQNVYCIHVDVKAEQVVKDAMATVARCFDNVFIASHAVSVVWGQYSVLEADMSCMEDLWKYTHWKYLINLTGQEFPLQTNWDMVRILKTLRGANNIASAKFIPSRLQYRHIGHKRLEELKSPPPVNFTLAKGSVHVAISRKFVDYALHKEDAIRWRKWLEDSGCPVESFFQPLYFSPHMGVPGANTAKLDENHRIPGYELIVRYKLWSDHTHEKCFGKYVREICIPGIFDLPTLYRRKEMFVNKFNYDYHPLAYDCLEELHRNRTIEDITGHRVFDYAYYEGLELWRNHTNL